MIILLDKKKYFKIVSVSKGIQTENKRFELFGQMKMLLINFIGDSGLASNFSYSYINLLLFCSNAPTNFRKT